MGVIGKKYAIEEVREMKVKHIIKLINGRFLNQEEEDQAKDVLKTTEAKQNKQKMMEKRREKEYNKNKKNNRKIIKMDRNNKRRY